MRIQNASDRLIRVEGFGIAPGRTAEIRPELFDPATMVHVEPVKSRREILIETMRDHDWLGAELTKSGKPTVEALMLRLDWDITARERDEAWSELQDAS